MGVPLRKDAPQAAPAARTSFLIPNGV